MTVRAIIDEVQRLPHAEQLELIDELNFRFGNTEADVALTPAQAADLRRRIAEAEAGRETSIPGDEAMARLRNRS